jgi:hypothetical protein
MITLTFIGMFVQEKGIKSASSLEKGKAAGAVTTFI